jgi:hypothetical protein
MHLVSILLADVEHDCDTKQPNIHHASCRSSNTWNSRNRIFIAAADHGEFFRGQKSRGGRFFFFFMVMVAMVMVMVPPHHEHYPIVPFARSITLDH